MALPGPPLKRHRSSRKQVDEHLGWNRLWRWLNVRHRTRMTMQLHSRTEYPQIILKIFGGISLIFCAAAIFVTSLVHDRCCSFLFKDHFTDPNKWNVIYIIKILTAVQFACVQPSQYCSKLTLIFKHTFKLISKQISIHSTACLPSLS